MQHIFFSVFGYELLLRSIASSYSPWANIAPGVFFITRTSSKTHPGLSVLIFLDHLFSRMC